MLRRVADVTVLGVFSMLYSVTVFLLKWRANASVPQKLDTQWTGDWQA